MEKSTVVPKGLKLEEMKEVDKGLELRVSTIATKVECPKCGEKTSQVHSNYRRIIKDLPCFGLVVYLILQVRKFFCLNQRCEQRIFCERVEAVSRYGRFSQRLNQIISYIGLANGGEAGTSLAKRLSIIVSPDTLLRRIRAFTTEEIKPVRVLGVDDWAKRKGQKYGTILVDLESHRPIALLADRTAETLAKWLKEHPEIEIISRDRAGAYIDGANKGAPQAIQVADRFHLLKNLTETTERFFKARTKDWNQAIKEVGKESQQTQASQVVTKSETESLESIPVPAKVDAKVERYLEVRALHSQGASIRAIANHFSMHRRTVRLYINCQTYPERSTPIARPSMIDKYAQYLEKRWLEGCHNAKQLWEELKSQGFKGSQSNLRNYLSKFRDQKPEHIKALTNSKANTEIPSTRQTAWLFGQKLTDRTLTQQTFINKLFQVNPEMKLVHNLAQAFSSMVREKNPSALDSFLTDAKNSAIKEFVNFADGLSKEKPSILAALTLKWSQGQVEGQVNRLKLLKRQMFGRAKLDLLSQRLVNKL
ncbi:MAG: ISL3 family transposase [Blastocatellia bacterium]|nr:ISL3 family transposase [Blastocatellia bacterium]